MNEPISNTPVRMSQGSSATGALPTPKTAGDWSLNPRPAESLDAAEVTIITGPDERGSATEPSTQH